MVMELRFEAIFNCRILSARLLVVSAIGKQQRSGFDHESSFLDLR